jgi:hypothetical protein
MTVIEAPLQQDRSRGIPELTRRMAGQGPDGPALGLTHSRLGTEIAYAMSAVPAGSGYCITLDRVDVKITLAITVFLAKELKPGSCLYREAEAHEQKHVDLERKLLPVARARVEVALAGVARRTVRGATIEAAGDQLQEQARKAVDAVLTDFAAEKKRQQLLFDTVEEYQKLSRRCSADEIRELLGG